ncbi:unnamed protein product [Ectocarpus sp. CCAP 1310/34]|nr:unnamed protein product [Ectocarpus sp. CCAP 1310/34]
MPPLMHSTPGQAILARPGRFIRGECLGAFGVHPDPTKSKNPGARDVIKVVIKVVENLNKSSNLRAKFEDLETELLGEVLKVVKHAPQRWLSMVRTMERIIRLWHALRKLYSDEGKVFPLEEGDNKNGVLQLYSLLEPLCMITRDGQYGGAPMMADIYMKMGILKMGMLNLEKELKVYETPRVGENGLPDREEQNKPLPHKMVAHGNLHPAAKKAREELCRALVARLFGRYWAGCVDPSFVDSSCLLTPPYSSGIHISAMKLTEEEGDYLPTGLTVLTPTTDEDVEDKKAEAWGMIKKRAIQAVKEDQAQANGSGDGGGDAGPFKRARTSGNGSARNDAGEDHFAVLCTAGAVEQSGSGDDGDLSVAGEIQRSRALQMNSSDLQPRDVLNYWKQSGRHAFPALNYVAQQRFGSQAYAAQIERDFSTGGLLGASNRNRLDEYWVEMVLFLKANFQCIPGYDDIPNMDSKSIRECLPAKFKGTNEYLLDAEMALDPLENKTPPNTSAIGDNGDG